MTRLSILQVASLAFRTLFGTTSCCRFAPSCSAYLDGAIARFGWFRGTWLGIFRLLKCGPWHSGGLDPVPLEGNLSARRTE